MKKNVPVLDLENYQKQNSIAIDMCAACIMHERKFNRPIKAIILSHAYFGILKKWVHDNYGEETAEKEFFLDAIEIRRERIYSGKTLLIEYYKPSELN
jgi:hypothetical protein